METNENKIKYTQEQKALLLELFSQNEQQILHAIKSLRSKGGIYSIKPLMEVYFSTAYTDVRTAINNLFADIKNNKLSSEIVTNLSKYKGHKLISEFIAALWQSSLSFEDMRIFTEIFMQSADKEAFECFTLMEQNIVNASENNKSECLSIIKKDVGKLGDFKKLLAVDLIELLKS